MNFRKGTLRVKEAGSFWARHTKKLNLISLLPNCCFGRPIVDLADQLMWYQEQDICSAINDKLKNSNQKMSRDPV